MLNRLALLVYLDPEFTQSVGVVPEEALSGEIAPGCCLFTNNITCTVRNFNFDLIEVVFFFGIDNPVIVFELSCFFIERVSRALKKKLSTFSCVNWCADNTMGSGIQPCAQQAL